MDIVNEAHGKAFLQVEVRSFGTPPSEALEQQLMGVMTARATADAR